VHELAQRVLGHIRREELLRPGDRLGIAVSGGIDSVALLRLLLEFRHELGIVISVVHFNHKLRGTESDRDQEFVRGLALEHDLDFHASGGDVGQLAAEEHSGLEAAARELRYGFFRKLLESGGLAEAEGAVHLNKIATGHTLDDQAETVLMRVIRGTGPRGLGGIHRRILVADEDEEGHGEIIRPLLGVRRSELESYLLQIKESWRDDSSNIDVRFTRNRLRKLVLPLLERELNPAVVEGLSELAEIARDEEDYWENEIAGWLGTVVQWSEPSWARQDVSLVQIAPAGGGPSSSVPMDSELRSRIEASPWLVMNASVSRPWLLTEPRAVQRRVIKAIGEQAGLSLEFKHVEEILRFADEDGPSGKELSLPLGWKLVRQPEAMLFITPDLRQSPQPVSNYEYTLKVPGRVFVVELGSVIEALRLNPQLGAAEYNPQQLLRAELLPERVIVRNWRAGDRFWPAHTKSPRKIKELLQERHVPQPERRLWPVVASGDEIVWMRGFPVPSRWLTKPGQEAVLIREIPWTDHEQAI